MSSETFRLASDLVDRLTDLGALQGFKAEITDGEIRMSPRRAEHWAVVQRFVGAALIQLGEDVHTISDVWVTFPHLDRKYAPDFGLIRPDHVGNGPKWHPEDLALAVEVVSDSSVEKDRVEKAAAYASSGVPVYVVVDEQRRECVVMTNPKASSASDPGRRAQYTRKEIVRYGEPLVIESVIDDRPLRLETSTFPRA